MPQAERRHLSVMFCDLVGSTPLSARLDPEDLGEVIRIYQSRVADAVGRFGGFIANYAGDGVLVYFGWPQAKETDAEGAVRAALAVVVAVGNAPVRGQALQVRVGIASGIVLAGELVGTGDARQQTAIGETLHLAARLQGIAEPGDVLIDDPTHRQIRSMFECRGLGAIKLKGLEKSVRAWKVLGERAADSRFAISPSDTLNPFVDRDEELELLLRRWRQAKNGDGQVVLLAGEPGIGKSRLIAELEGHLDSEPHSTLRYLCSPLFQGSPLYPVLARWERELGFACGDTPAEKHDKLEAMLLPARTPREDVALIADLLGMPPRGKYPSLDISSQRKKEKTFAALARRLVDRAREQPVLMLLEDVHWADPSTLELLDMVIGRLSGLPILIILSFRPEFTVPWVGNANVTLVMLNRLTRVQAAQLAAKVMNGCVLSPALLDRIVAQTDGIPLFIEELTKSALETAEEHSGSTPVLAVPGTLQALLLARLDRLPAAKRVAQIGAAIGRDFSYPLLATAAQMPERRLAQGLDELVASGLVFCRGAPPDATYTFKHALVQEVAYDSILRSRRAEIHARIVAAAEGDASFGVTEPSLLGHHCAQAGLLAKAAGYYRIAGGRSAKHAAAAETRTHFERGLQFARSLPDGQDRYRLEAELLIALGRFLMVTKGPSDPDVGIVFERAVAVCRGLDSPEMLARALYSLGITAETRAELRTGRTIGEELLALAVKSDDTGIAIAARVRLGIVAYYQGRFATARDNLAEAIALCEGNHVLVDIAVASAPHVAAAAYLGATLAHLGYAEQAIAQGEMANECARQVGPSSSAFALSLSVWHRTLELLRDDRRCGECTRMLVTICEEQGFSFLLALGKCQLGWVTAKQDDVIRGLGMLSEALASLDSLGAKTQLNVAKYMESDVLAWSGQHSAAIAMLDEVLAFSSCTEAAWLDAELHRRKAELLLLSSGSNTAVAEQGFLRAIDIARNQSAKVFELRAAVGLARILSSQGRYTEARALLVSVHSWFTEGFETPDLRDARELIAELDAACM